MSDLRMSEANRAARTAGRLRNREAAFEERKRPDLLTPLQKEYIRGAACRWNVKTGATRSGKTWLDTAYIIPKRILSVKGKPGLTVFLGNTKGTLQRNVIEPLQERFGAERVSSIRSDNTADIFGEKVYCLGADNKKHVDRLRGSSIKYCYGDEVVTWSAEVFDMLKSRLDKPYSMFDGTCNPAGPDHWFKDFLDSGADLFQQTYTLDDNPFLDPKFVSALKKEYEGTVLYDRYILGLWAGSPGALFTEHPPVETDMRKIRDGIAHIDAAYGGEDYTAFTCARRDGDTLYIYGRLYKSHVDTCLHAIIAKANELMCGPIYLETNADKGYLGREIRRAGGTVRLYAEKMNKFVKIASYGHKWWKNVVIMEGTDPKYLSQIQSYDEEAEHDDAPDSFSCCARILDRSALALEYI